MKKKRDETKGAGVFASTIGLQVGGIDVSLGVYMHQACLETITF